MNVRKGQYNGQEVAVKILNDLRRSRGVRAIQLAVFFNELILSRAEILRVGCDMEDFSPPERVAVVRRHNDQTSAHDRIELDGEWEYQQIFEGSPRCQSTGTCTFTGCPSFLVDNGVE